jgi:hypothetical protein
MRYQVGSKANNEEGQVVFNEEIGLACERLPNNLTLE